MTQTMRQDVRPAFNGGPHQLHCGLLRHRPTVGTYAAPDSDSWSGPGTAQARSNRRSDQPIAALLVRVGGAGIGSGTPGWGQATAGGLAADSGGDVGGFAL